MRLGVVTAVMIWATWSVAGSTGSTLPGLAGTAFWWLMASIYLVLGLSALGLALRPEPRRFAWVQVFADTGMVTALVLLTGGSEGSPVVSLYAASIAGAAALLGRPAALAMATVNGAALLGLALSAPHQEPNWGVALSTQIMGFYLIALLAGELAALAQREREQAQVKGQELAGVLQSLRSGLVLLGADGRVKEANEAARRLLPDLETGIPGGSEGEMVWEIELGGRIVIATRTPLPQGGEVVSLEDITPIRELQARLQRNERVAAVGRLSAGLAHEIRNPLAAIGGAAQLLRPAPGDEGIRDLVLREVQRLNRLVDDYLANASARPSALVRQPMAPLLEDVAQGFRADPRFGHVQVEVELGELPPMPLDADRLRQALWNLLINAAQAMPDGGLVRVVARREGPAVLLRISDDGIGIPPEELPRIFDAFHTRRAGGTGLGLAVVDQVMAEHGAKVGVASAPGQGTTFSFHFPVQDA